MPCANYGQWALTTAHATKFKGDIKEKKNAIPIRFDGNIEISLMKMVAHIENGRLKDLQKAKSQIGHLQERNSHGASPLPVVVTETGVGEDKRPKMDIRKRGVSRLAPPTTESSFRYSETFTMDLSSTWDTQYYTHLPSSPTKELLSIATSRAIAVPETSMFFENSTIPVDFKSSAKLGKLMMADYEMCSKYKEFIIWRFTRC